LIRFISDLHISPETRGISKLFNNFLFDCRASSQAGEIIRLYILGDLFEAWVGDDDGDPNNPAASPCYVETVEQLRLATDVGVKIALLHGNRDFLLGQHFSVCTGVELLPDPFLLYPTDNLQVKYLLTHGDQLCTDDTEYQALRRMVRSSEWQNNFLAMALDERRATADRMRQQSKMVNRTRTANATLAETDTGIMDVTLAAVKGSLLAHSCNIMIHGHTHRPGYHQHNFDGKDAERWVLADWRENADSTASGEYLSLHDGKLERQAICS